MPAATLLAKLARDAAVAVQALHTDTPPSVPRQANRPATPKKSDSDKCAAAVALGKLGGRPKGSRSAPLAIWLEREIRQLRRYGYRCREAFEILAATERQDSADAFVILDETADREDYRLIDSRVTLNYFRKVWRECSPR
jgi:hypothetical protein